MADDIAFTRFVAHLEATSTACLSVSHAIIASTSILSGIPTTYIGLCLASEGKWYGASIAATGVSAIYYGWTHACKIDLSKTKGHPESTRNMGKTLLSTILTIMGLLTAPPAIGVGTLLPNKSATFLICGGFLLASGAYQVHSLSQQTSEMLSMPRGDLHPHFEVISAQAANTG